MCVVGGGGNGDGDLGVGVGVGELGVVSLDILGGFGWGVVPRQCHLV